MLNKDKLSCAILFNFHRKLYTLYAVYSAFYSRSSPPHKGNGMVRTASLRISEPMPCSRDQIESLKEVVVNSK